MGAVGKVRPRVSYADLERAPEDGRRYELYDGEVYVVPAPIPRHQRVQIRLVGWLDEYAESVGGFMACSPIDIVFSEYDVLQPDVVFFGPARAHLIDLDRAIRHAPDVCSYTLVQRASGDDEVTSPVLPGAALRAGSIFP